MNCIFGLFAKLGWLWSDISCRALFDHICWDLVEELV